VEKFKPNVYAGRNKSGGEGGIRTLGTGISQYNGLASLSFDAVPIGFNGLQADYLTLVGPNRSHTALSVLHFVLHFREQELLKVDDHFHVRYPSVIPPAVNHPFGSSAEPGRA
jgi:hypothetical protein